MKYPHDVKNKVKPSAKFFPVQFYKEPSTTDSHLLHLSCYWIQQNVLPLISKLAIPHNECSGAYNFSTFKYIQYKTGQNVLPLISKLAIPYNKCSGANNFISLKYIEYKIGQHVKMYCPSSKSAIPYNECLGENNFSTFKYIQYKIGQHVKMYCPSFLNWQFHTMNVRGQNWFQYFLLHNIHDRSTCQNTLPIISKFAIPYNECSVVDNLSVLECTSYKLQPVKV